jgi:hypothetical protein
MIPKAKMEALLNAPPEKASIKPRIPVLFWSPAVILVGSIPGSTMCEPRRYIAIIIRVKMILPLRSSMLQIFLSVCINFFTGITKI